MMYRAKRPVSCTWAMPSRDALVRLVAISMASVAPISSRPRANAISISMSV